MLLFVSLSLSGSISITFCDLGSPVVKVITDYEQRDFWFDYEKTLNPRNIVCWEESEALECTTNSDEVPPALEPAQQDELKGAVQQWPSASGLDLANWNWKAVHQFILEGFGSSISRSSCLNYLHRMGFAFKRPKKNLVKADEEKREAFASEYVSLWQESQGTGGRIFFVDEAHFRADVELRGKWVLQGEPALVESTSPK